MTLRARLTAEALGTCLLLAIVIGSGVMAERLSGGNAALALLANAIATGAGLGALILALGGVSAHFNPVVSLAAAAAGTLRWRELPWYAAAQVGGAVTGAAVAHLMFGLPVVATSLHERSGAGQLAGELVATFGLLLVLAGAARRGLESTALAAGGYILAAYWFTSSTSFANPAVTVARSLTDTFTGIRPIDMPAFVAAQLAGAGLAIAASRVVFREQPP